MISSRRFPPLLRAAIVVSVLLAGAALGGCSNEDDTAAAGSTTAAETTTSIDDPSGSTTDRPLSAREASAALRAEVEEADGDLCGLLEVFRGLRLPRPTSSNEASATVDAVEALLGALADATPDGQEEAADTLRTVASELRRRAESTGFEPGRLAELGPIINPADPTTTRAIGALEELAELECQGG